MAFLSLLFVHLCLGDYRNHAALARASDLPFFAGSMQKYPDAKERVAEKSVLMSQQG